MGRVACALLIIVVGCDSGNLILKRPDGSTIAKYTTPLGQSEYLTNGDSICVANTHVSFHHDASAPIAIAPSLPALPDDGISELYLFSQDPATTDNLLAALTDDQIRAGQWDVIASQPARLPSAQLIQFPTRVGQSTTTPVELDLTQRMFWPAGVDPAAPDVACVPFKASEPVAQGRLTTALVYQRGLCSADVSMDDIMGQFFDTFFDEFKKKVALNSTDAPAHARYGRMITLLDHVGPTPMGGFQMSFHFSYTHAALGGDVWGTYRFQFNLPGPSFLPSTPVRSVPGGLGLTASEVAIHSSGGYSSFVQDDVHNNLLNSSERFRAALASKTVVPTSAQKCTSPSSSASLYRDCKQPAADLGAMITLDKLRASGMPNATETDVSHLRCTIGVMEECTKLKVLGLSFFNRWQCVPFQNDPANDPICQFTLAPARFYVTPDHLSLVWLDKPDLDNPSYAILVAYGASHPFVSGMCASHPSSNLAASVSRGFATIVVDNR